MAATALMEKFLAGPTGRKLQAEAEGEELGKRKALAAELAGIRDQEGEEVPKLAAASEKARLAVLKAQETVREAQAAHARAMSASLGGSTSFSAKIGRLEGELRPTADPEIAAFIAHLGELAEATRNSLVSGAERLGWQGLRAVIRPASNAEAVRRRLAAIAAAREVALALQLEPLGRVEVEKRLAKLRQGLEAPDVAA